MDRLTAAWRWWIDGLTDAVAIVVSWAGRGRRLRLVPVPGGHVLVGAEGRLGDLRLDGEGSAIRLVPEQTALLLKNRDVDVAIAPERCVTLKIGPLPPESRGFLDDVVAHRLARAAPWTRADTLRTHRVETVGPDDPRLTVSVEATSRGAIAPLATALRAAGAGRVRAVRLDPAGAVASVFPLAAEDAVGRRATARWIGFALAAVVGLATAVAWSLLDRIDADGIRLEEVEARVADYRRRLTPVGGGEAQALADLARRTPLAVSTLEALTQAVPDDTHLTELTLTRDRSSLKGITADIGALSRRLEATAGFEPPVFTESAVIEDTGARFALDLRPATKTEAPR